MEHLQTYELFEGLYPYGFVPTKVIREIKLTSTTNREVTITITMDQNYRITFVKNPRGINFPFKMNNILNKHQLSAWETANGFKGLETQSKERLRGNELVKYIMKRGY